MSLELKWGLGRICEFGDANIQMTLKIREMNEAASGSSQIKKKKGPA